MSGLHCVFCGVPVRGRRDHVLRRDPETGFKVAKRTILLDQSTLLAKVVTFFF